MRRPITGFALDDEGDWTATLGCGHRQHVRHKPPFVNRPWVVTETGRNGTLGELLDCVRCDRLELPESFVAYRKTPVFDETSIPNGLRKNHATKPGVWGKIVVLEGRLRYTLDASRCEMELSETTPGFIAPEALHRVEPIGATRFFVEFYKSPEGVT